MRLATIVALLLVSLPAPAMATAETSGCTAEANVRWSVDRQTLVDAAIVEVPGCPDGQDVGLQLITDSGDVPTEPLIGAVEGERVTFDLTAYALHVEPITGVRVLLHGQDDADALEIIIEERFFNPAGNEQIGLRESTLIRVPRGGEYNVPDAPRRYRVAPCDDLGVGMDDSVIGEGPGTHVATTPGRHLVCYQQTSGQRPSDDTDVLGNVLTRDGDAIDGDINGGPLPLTGASALGLVALAVALVAAGGILVRRRRELTPPR